MIRLRGNIDLKGMTTFGLPALCGRLVEFSEPETDLPELDRRGLLEGAILLGGGSNMLFTAPAPRLTVIHPVNNSITTVESANGHTILSADAGVILDDLCQHAVRKGLWGLENLSGIPGHIGGATVQNVGAYGTEFKDVVVSVTCYSCKSRGFVTLRAEDCGYGYRDSIFKHQSPDEKLIVCRTTVSLAETPTPRLGYKGLYDSLCSRFTLSPDMDMHGNVSRLIEKGLTPADVRETVISLRNSKLPLPSETGSAGSFFKNPVVTPTELSRIISVWESSGDTESTPLPYHQLPDGNLKLSAAWLIDKSGCKPLTHGGAALWQNQPLVIVNRSGKARGEDVVNLEKSVIERVKSVFGITLFPEVVHI